MKSLIASKLGTKSEIAEKLRRYEADPMQPHDFGPESRRFPSNPVEPETEVPKPGKRCKQKDTPIEIKLPLQVMGSGKYSGKQGAWLIVKAANQLLIARRSPQAHVAVGKWNWIGGGVDVGEDPKTAAIREFKEEAGFEIHRELVHYLAAINNPISGGTCHFFICTKPQDLKITLNEENDKFKWVTVDTLLRAPSQLNWPTLASLGPLSALLKGVK